MIYGNINERMSGDIDILCNIDDFGKISEYLKSNNYLLIEPYDKFSNIQLKYTFKHNKHIGFVNKSKRLMIEVHWKLISINYINNQQIFSINNLQRNQDNKITPESVLHLIIHGTTHKYFRLFWLRDIYHIARNHPELFEQLIKLAEKLDGRKYFVITMNLISEIFNYEHQSMNVFQPNKQERWMINLCLKYIFNKEREPKLRNTINNTRYLMNLRDSLLYKAEVLRYIFIQPVDQKLLPLPESLLFLNYPLGPVYRFIQYIDKRIKWRKIKVTT